MRANFGALSGRFEGLSTRFVGSVSQDLGPANADLILGDGLGEADDGRGPDFDRLDVSLKLADGVHDPALKLACFG